MDYLSTMGVVEGGLGTQLCSKGVDTIFVTGCTVPLSIFLIYVFIVWVMVVLKDKHFPGNVQGVNMLAGVILF